ncbi:TPA: hypothetical protein ACY3HR_005551 [Citrobacter freundii]|uniref:hypothetical protein n=1 Tax=Citrobacter freundii TaxID=546 RepID=UPI0028742461|nr:hypothetical protein [Citrobacter freundii]MDS0992100.1 hypothetical protein [Citrobacter freundii]
MSDTYAVVENDVVTNLVIWDGKSEWMPETGTAVRVNGACGIGWRYDGKTFIAPVSKPGVVTQSGEQTS